MNLTPEQLEKFKEKAETILALCEERSVGNAATYLIHVTYLIQELIMETERREKVEETLGKVEAQLEAAKIACNHYEGERITAQAQLARLQDEMARIAHPEFGSLVMEAEDLREKLTRVKELLVRVKVISESQERPKGEDDFRLRLFCTGDIETWRDERDAILAEPTPAVAVEQDGKCPHCGGEGCKACSAQCLEETE